MAAGRIQKGPQKTTPSCCTATGSHARPRGPQTRQLASGDPRTPTPRDPSAQQDDPTTHIPTIQDPPALDGDSTLSGTTGSAELDFSDLWDFVDFGVSGRLEAWNGRWGLFFDGSYLDLGAEYTESVGPAAIDTEVDLRQTILDFGLAYRLVQTPVGRDGTQSLTLDSLGGLRYEYLKQEAELNVAVGPFAAGTTLGGDEEWVEPFVGARLTWGVGETVAVVIRGDIGGFGIGSASDLTWNLLAGVDWQFRKNMALKAGYRILDIDYERGSGTSAFGLDAQMKGPILGLAIYF